MTAIENSPVKHDGTAEAQWHQSACILCESNCGVEIRVGTDGRTFERVRGDKTHPGSKGYTCEKALRLNYYQNGRGERLLNPQRRRADGTYEEIDWDTAIAEVAAKFAAVRDTHGGESIVYYGGGGQGNHLGGAYGTATLGALGAKYKSNALAQEKTGEALVLGKMFGTMLRSDFERCDVAFFIGKNPWISHGMPHARRTLKAIANDPDRTMIVIDPRVTETAAMAEFHLQVRPGCDAWLLGAMAAILVEEKLIKPDWLREHAVGLEPVLATLSDIPIGRYCEISGVEEELVRAATRQIGGANGVATFEDLGVQMNRNSTLVSYLNKLVWVLTGNLGNPGGHYAMSSIGALLRLRRAELASENAPVSPVVGAKIISGLIPCNVIADEILTDHPKRYRAMIVESGNPLHSIADSQRMRKAIRSLDVSVCIDVFITETARESDYVLPATTQYEKHEATFFNFEFPKNVFHLRQPIVDAPEGPLPEPEIHARLVEALVDIDADLLSGLRVLAEQDRVAFGVAFAEAVGSNPELGAIAPVLLYRTLGPTLPNGAVAAATLWPMTIRSSQMNAAGVERAGFGTGLEAGDRLFDAIVASPTAVVFSDDEWDVTWQRIQTADGQIHLEIPELLAELASLATTEMPGPSAEWPFVLSAGERRAFTANTIFRDPEWRKRDLAGALRISPEDASQLGLDDAGSAMLTTKRASVVVSVSIDDTMRSGHIALPNGFGLDHAAEGGRVQTGVSPNELTASEDRDPWAGTPWHKFVPAKLEALAL